jgi:putative endonuclease
MAGSRFSGWATRLVIRALDALAKVLLRPPNTPQHQITGRQGEEEAYFYLRRQGYIMVARNYRSPHYHGEIDLIGWDGDVLCFVEVKTRTTRDVKPAEAAVDSEKQHDLAAVATDYLRHISGRPPWRFDVMSVYYDVPQKYPEITLFKNAFSMS